MKEKFEDWYRGLEPEITSSDFDPEATKRVDEFWASIEKRKHMTAEEKKAEKEENAKKSEMLKKKRWMNDNNWTPEDSRTFELLDKVYKEKDMTKFTISQIVKFIKND